MDAMYYRAQLDAFMSDWRHLRLDEVFGRPEDYFKVCLAANAGQRRLGLNAMRANPRLVGYSMTALHDEASCGEGPITFLRDLKPGAVDAIRTSHSYGSGLYVAVYRHGRGKVILNCLEIRKALGKDPVAERLLCNMLNYAGA